mgnify:CR=1 FL=1
MLISPFCALKDSSLLVEGSGSYPELVEGYDPSGWRGI